MPGVLIGGEKGGTGKTTIATNLAIMASIMGHDVILVDCDIQASSAKFINERNARDLKHTPSCVQLVGKYLYKEIDKLSKKYEIVIADASGQDSVELRSAMSCLSIDKFYTILRPSRFDLDTIYPMDDLVDLVLTVNPELKSYLLFNQCPTNPKITLLKEALDFVKDLQNIKLMNQKIQFRVPFQYAPDEYLSAIEYELERINEMPKYQKEKYSPKGSIEICSLYEHVFNEQFKGEINAYFKQSNAETAQGIEHV